MTASEIVKIAESAPAKINLVLAVSTKIIDGRHQLNSVFTTLSLADHLQLKFQPASNPGYNLDMRYAPGLPKLKLPPEKNIITKALRCFTKRRGADFAGSLTVHLDKRIPSAAGLGGGSSDAAAMIRALARLDGQPLDAPICAQTAAEVGSDVSFFLQGGCSLIGAGGQSVEAHFQLPVLDILLVKPVAGVSTTSVYRRFDSDPQPVLPGVGELVALLSGSAVPSREQIASALNNNLQPAALSFCPEDATIIERLEAQPGVLRALVSGSGSTVFGLCENAAAAVAAARQFSGPDYWTCVTQTNPAWVFSMSVTPAWMK